MHYINFIVFYVIKKMAETSVGCGATQRNLDRLVKQKPHEVQQGEMQSPSCGEEQPQAPGCTGGHPAGKEPGRKGL